MQFEVILVLLFLKPLFLLQGRTAGVFVELTSSVFWRPFILIFPGWPLLICLLLTALLIIVVFVISAIPRMKEEVPVDVRRVVLTMFLLLVALEACLDCFVGARLCPSGRVGLTESFLVLRFGELVLPVPHLN